MHTVTCVVNAHRESHLIYPTLRSVMRAREHAHECGISTGLLVILDSADSLTRDIVNEQVLADDRVLEVDYNELAGSRNFAISKIDSKYTAFLDGDDLWCKSWLVESYLLAEKYPGDCVIHPAYNVYFGGDREYILKHTDTDSDQFCAEFLLEKNYWTALSFAKTEIFRSTPYRQNRLSQGFGYEDWTWNWQTLKNNIAHKVAPQTAHYIRRGKNYTSLLEQTSNSNAIPHILEIYKGNNGDNVDGTPIEQRTAVADTSAPSNNSKLQLENSLTTNEDAIAPVSLADAFYGGWQIKESRLTAQLQFDLLKNLTVDIYVDNQLNGSHSLSGTSDKATVQSDSDSNISLRIEGLDRNKVHDINVQVKESGKEINNLTLRYCPLLEAYRDQISTLFFADFYASKYGIDNTSDPQAALTHFMASGLYDDHMPNPWFSPDYYREHHSYRLSNIALPLLSFLHFELHGHLNPCSNLDVNYYKKNHVTDEGSPFVHFVNHGHQQGYSTKQQALPEFLANETIALSRFELNLQRYNCSTKTVIEYPRIDRLSHTPAALKQTYGDSISCIICVDSEALRHSMATAGIRALQQQLGIHRVLVCVTNGTHSTIAGKLSADTRHVCFDGDHWQPAVDRKIWALHTVVGTLCPDLVVNFESQAAWGMYSRYGQQLQQVTRLVCGIRSLNYQHDGAISGNVSQYLSSCIEHLDTIVTDNQRVIEQIAELWGYPAQLMRKFHCVYTPYQSPVKKSTQKAQSILWAHGSSQPPALLEQVTTCFADIQFTTCHDNGTINTAQTEELAEDSESHPLPIDSPIGSYAAFLTTDVHGGLQESLINAALHEVPVIAAVASHNADFATDDNCWMIQDPQDLQSITLAIRQFLVQADKTQHKVEKAAETARNRHNWSAYISRLQSIGVLPVSSRISEPDIDTAA